MKNLDRGGTERHLLNLLPRLIGSRFTPVIFTSEKSGELAPQLTCQGIEVIAPWITVSSGNPFRFLLKPIAAIASLIQFVFLCLSGRFDIFHFFLPYSYMLFAPLALLTGRRRLVMSRRSLNNYQSKYPGCRTIELFLHKRMSLLLGNSSQVVRQLTEEEHAPAARTKLIYNGIPDLPRSGEPDRLKIREKLQIAPQQLVLIIVANLIAYKGHEDLLHALSGTILPEEWVILLVGRDGGCESRLRTLAEELGIRDHIRFLGSAPDVTPLLQAADIGVLSSHEEGFSNAILEAMQAGLPMVVTDVGGNGEAVVDGENGYVVPPHAPAELGEAIARLAASPDLRSAFGAANRDRVTEFYSIEACAASYQCAYEELCKGDPA